jgi:ribosome maturation factor RimP
VEVRASGRPVTARIIDVEAAGVILESGRFEFAELGPGRVQVELKRLDDVVDDEGEDEE